MRKKLRSFLRRALTEKLGVNRDAKLIDHYLSETVGPKKLQLGCGRNYLTGWLNSDFYPRTSDILHLDVTAPLPFPEGVFDYVFSEHVIEHISYPSGVLMLRECFRVLKPGGVIRIATPDLAFLINLYRADESSTQPREAVQQEFLEFFLANEIKDRANNAPIDLDVYLINKFVRAWGHEFIYDEKTLKYVFNDLGFTDVVRRDVMESGHTALQDIENIDRKPPGHIALETVVLEGSRPI
ncbi:methyltransferase domain-containing protein [Luminiphilus sp.]|nr:methyltransferase domain-containing protein [Luminiphilus sp.]